MMASWMVHCIVVALCFGLAAMAAEHLARLYGKPARGVWAVALVASLLVPVVNWALVIRVDSFGGRLAVPLAPVTTSLLTGSLRAYAPTTPLLPGWDAALAAVWLGMSLTLVALLVGSFRRLARERGGWREATVEGRRVLVSHHVGPAVVGVMAPVVVVPDWLLGLSSAVKRVALQHEEEHQRVGDLRLMLVASLAVVVCPWNIPLWWQLRRLRTALEADCDARVLDGGADIRTYGTLLLEVGSRVWYRRLATMALIERRSSLARRIEIMTSRPKLRIAQACVAVGLATAFALLACETPVPSQSGDEEGDIMLVGEVYAEGAVDQPPERISSPPMEYPRLLMEAGIEGHVLLQAIVGIDGAIEPGSVEILESTDRGFELPARRLLERSVFRPARVNGSPVRVLIQLPIQFAIVRGLNEEAPDAAEDLITGHGRN
jgi:bla regulator protein BlaR1